MSAIREIPGYYFDPERKRYFKIESNGTAPSGATWSSESVKRRKVADKEASLSRKREEQARGRIKRSRVLTEPLTGGFLLRETGRHLPEVPIASWAKGFREKGSVLLSPLERSSSVNISQLYVGNRDFKLGYGVAYGTLDDETLLGCYIPRGSHDRIDRNVVSRYRNDGRMPRAELIRCPQMSSLKYHEPSNKVLLTSREPGSRIGIYSFSPQASYGDNEPEWAIGGADYYEYFARVSTNSDCAAHTCAPAPPSSNLICAVGTTDGILQFQREGPLTWLEAAGGPAARARARARDVLALDFLPRNPSVLLAGSRTGQLAVADVRARPGAWDTLRHRSAVAHARAVNEHQVLAAGPRSAMALYDLRYRRRRGAGAGAALLRFPAFRNAAHVHFGLDVDAGAGVAAAAHDDGTVALYSLRSGRRLACPAVDRVAAPGVVRGLMFQTLPRDKLPSLFLGIGPDVCKYSFGVEDEDGEPVEE